MSLVHRALGTYLVLLTTAQPRARRDERGLSQSTEQAILVACAVAVAALIVAAVTGLVTTKLAGVQ